MDDEDIRTIKEQFGGDIAAYLRWLRRRPEERKRERASRDVEKTAAAVPGNVCWATKAEQSRNRRPR